MSESVEKVPPIPSTTTATATCRSQPAAANSKPVVVTAQMAMESDSLSLNQQLANHGRHLAQVAVIGKPVAKRKRGSIDQRSPLGMKAQQPFEMRKIGFIGAGNIARAIAEGWISGGQVKAVNMTATVRSPYSANLKLMKVVIFHEATEDVTKALGVNVSIQNRDVIGQCDMVVIAVKPYQLMEVMEEIHQVFKNPGSQTPKTLRPLVVSVAAAVPLVEIEKKAEISWNIGGSPITGHLPIIRCVPNTGCAVQSGVTVFTKGKYCNEEDIKPFVSLFASLGHCEEVEEKYMDAFTALTGSGVAFMEIALESMADGGVLAGIPHPISLRMCAHTMLGAANLILKKHLHPAQVKDAVASPGGTTISGILALESGGFRAAMINAVKAAVDRAIELNQS